MNYSNCFPPAIFTIKKRKKERKKIDPIFCEKVEKIEGLSPVQDLTFNKGPQYVSRIRKGRVITILPFFILLN